MKKSINISLTLLIVLTAFGCVNVFKLSDLRSEHPVLNNPEKAKQLMAEMGVAHRIHMWDSIESYTANFGDEFYGLLGKAGNPFEEDEMTLALSYMANSFDGQLKITSGKEKGKVWGIQSWKTYQQDENGVAVLDKNDDMKFWIPTYQYFIEFPKRIQETTVLDYVGTETINGIESEGIVVSWNTLDPQKDIDQYLIWLDTSTKRIVKIEYTIREVNHFISGKASFQDYKDFDGFLLPTAFPVESNLMKEGLLHKMSIVDFNTNTVDSKTLRPLE